MQGPRSGREGGPRSGPEKLSSAPRFTSSIRINWSCQLRIPLNIAAARPTIAVFKPAGTLTG